MNTASQMASIDAEIANLMHADGEAGVSESATSTAEPAPEGKPARKPRKDKGIKKGPSGKSRAKKATKPAVSKRKSKARAESGDESEDGEQDFKKRIGNTKHDVRHYAKVKSAAGSSSLDCADKVAQELRGLDLDAVYSKVAKTLGETQVSLREKYKHLNPGMQRMNLGNRYRAALAE